MEEEWKAAESETVPVSSDSCIARLDFLFSFFDSLAAVDVETETKCSLNGVGEVTEVGTMAVEEGAREGTAKSEDASLLLLKRTIDLRLDFLLSLSFCLSEISEGDAIEAEVEDDGRTGAEVEVCCTEESSLVALLALFTFAESLCFDFDDEEGGRTGSVGMEEDDVSGEMPFDLDGEESDTTTTTSSLFDFDFLLFALV